MNIYGGEVEPRQQMWATGQFHDLIALSPDIHRSPSAPCRRVWVGAIVGGTILEGIQILSTAENLSTIPQTSSF